MIGWPIILLYLCIYTYVQRKAIVRVYLHVKQKKTSAKEVPEASRWYM